MPYSCILKYQNPYQSEGVGPEQDMLSLRDGVGPGSKKSSPTIAAVITQSLLHINIYTLPPPDDGDQTQIWHACLA